ncbi:hypothetical protein [Pseudomonas muyukensis]|uniref:Thymidylate kinase n=1 Tax=Pseudomonas muyukensis TaxID=2842357 RepID=A0ABX8M3E2_9PSED|nr:hypothetical protein [Pseudomonas muyukensis]QXH33563.1 hypothetical protein KSS95_15405 [Pseudomonas muyukensis]
MIVVVEGISAGGKTTWCSRHGGEHVVAEHGRFANAPDRAQQPQAAAAFWAERNVERWQAALQQQARSAWAICDSDPLKLHYIWTLWRTGEASEQDWRLERDATRATLAQGRIGFADRYLVARIDPQLARERAKADLTRRRSNFELHVRLQPALLEWYAALESALPGRVRFDLPAALPALERQASPCALTTFDRMLAALPRA